MFIGLFLAARWVTVTDVQMLRILLNSAKYKTQYDPGKEQVFRHEVISQ
jgi:hypothetical protein